MELDVSMSRAYVFRTVRSTGICALSQYEVNFISPDFWLKCTFSNFILQSFDVTTLMVAHVHPIGEYICSSGMEQPQYQSLQSWCEYACTTEIQFCLAPMRYHMTLQVLDSLRLD